MSWIVMAALAISALSAVVAVLGFLRAHNSQPQDPSLQAMRDEVMFLRESTNKSMQTMSSGFSTQLQAVTANVHTAISGLAATVGDRLDAMNQHVSEQVTESLKMMSSSSDAVNQSIGAAQGTFAGLQKQVGEMSEQARQLSEISKSITDLQRVLIAPKLRGEFGEAQLGNLLGMVFAREQYELQYRFPSGDIADAVLYFPQGMVAIDSKFPLENFRRMAEANEEATRKSLRREFLKDVRRRADEVAAKYICPSDGTLPFALMYVPAENVYYECIIRDDDGNDLHSYCLQRKVVPVSPNSFYAYLQTILLGLNSMRVSERAEAMLRDIDSLGTELRRFSESYKTLGSHIRNASSKFDDGAKALDKVEGRVESLTGRGQSNLFEVESQGSPTLKASAS